MDEAVKVPLRARSGEIRAYTLIDTEKAPEVSAYRWSLSARGYAWRATSVGPRATRKYTVFYLHRHLLGVLGDKTVEVDHLNGDRLDNRLANLRVVPLGANAQNRNFCNTGTSRYRGVSWYKRSGVWRAKAHLDGKQHHVGHFDSEVAAARAAEAWRLEHMPFANPDPELVKYYQERDAVH